jgi:hypothetical protein
MSNVLPDTRPECGVAAAAVHGGKIYPFREWLADTADFTRTLWHELLRYLRLCPLPPPPGNPPRDWAINGGADVAVIPAKRSRIAVLVIFTGRLLSVDTRETVESRKNSGRKL